MNNSNNSMVDFCSELLAEVGEGLVRDFHSAVRSRNRGDMFRRFKEVNGSASRRIETTLTQEFPHVRWLDAEFDASEYESVAEGDYWLCDPIDGALNFLQGIPSWSSSLCLIHNGHPQLSLVYDPCQKELFHAVAEQGAFVNGVAMNVSDTRDISNAIFSTAHPTFIQDFMEDSIQTTKDLSDILPNSQATRMMGTVSLQLAYVASGRFDGYWEHGFDMYDWLAGAFLVQEAGGTVIDTLGSQFTWGAKGIIATNSALSSQLRTKLMRVHQK